MTQTILNGVLLDEHTELTLNDLCQACSTSAEWIIELVGEGVLEPINYQQTHWRFTGLSLKKAQTAIRLQRDLGINIAGIALALELLDEVESLQTKLNCFEIYEK